MSHSTMVPLGTPVLRGPVACVDLETTGGMAAHHRIIEVGIVLLDGGEVVEQWSSLVNPGVRIPPSIEGFTGITNEMVADAPAFADLRTEVRRRLAGRLFVAHNARFDYGFMRNEFRRSGERFSAPVLCTVRLSRTLFREHARHNLDTLIERWGLECGARHRALGDAAVLSRLLAAFERAVGPERMQAAAETARHDSKLPAQLPAELADDLPDGPGVYVFRGEGGTPLYVGKGRSLRSRVLEHFASGHRPSRESLLAQQVRAVEWVETGGELGALLLESRLVKELAPTANRRLRGAPGACCIRLHATPDGLGFVIGPLGAGDFESDAACYGPFRSERDAHRALEGKAREAGLCLKVLGLERTEGSCFAYQVGRCRGACVGRESRVMHDARLRVALASLRVRPWPFEGPVGIREATAQGDGTVLHVIDRWRHLGTARNAGEVEELLQQSPAGSFDADGYRTIVRTLDGLAGRELVRLERRSP